MFYKTKILNIICFVILFIFLTKFAFSVNIDKHQLFVNEVFELLLGYLPNDEKIKLPVHIEVTQDTSISASTSYSNYNEKTNQFELRIKLTTALLDDLVRGNEHFLAFILGHELSHIRFGHLVARNGKDLTSNFHSLDEEFLADCEAVKLAVDAGYSAKEIYKCIQRLIGLGVTSCSFESLKKEHPPWSDRLARLDSSRSQILHSLTAFHNGNLFIQLQQWEPAIYCFKDIIKRYPDCYEAHSNLGYAKLMKYISNLDIDDLKDLNIGYYVTGLYYKNPITLSEKIRGIDLNLWWEAVTDLKYSIKLNENAIFARANLGLAYVVAPLDESKFANASKHFADAVELAENDTSLSLEEKAAIYFNAGLSSYMTQGSSTEISISMEKFENFERQFGEFGTRSQNNLMLDLMNAKLFSQAIHYENENNRESKQKALILYEEFISNSDKNLPWKSIAIEKHNLLSKNFGEKPKNFNTRKKSTDNRLKPVISIKLVKNQELFLSDRTEKVLEQLKNYSYSSKKMIPGKNLELIYYSDLGLELLASEYLFAIIMKEKCSTSIELLEYSPSKTKQTIQLGMQRVDYEKTLEKSNYILLPFSSCFSKQYRYYTELGLAISFGLDGVIDEIIIVQR